MSIMEILVNSAVTDICRLVDDGAAVLHFEISRSKSENENLRLKLQLMERELQTVRKAKKTVNSVGTQVRDLLHCCELLNRFSESINKRSTACGWCDDFTEFVQMQWT